MGPWDDLKHSIKVYLAVTKGPSEALCSHLLKLPDFIDDGLSGKDSDREMSILAYSLIREIGCGTLERLNQLRNRPGLADTRQRLSNKLLEIETIDPKKARDILLDEIVVTFEDLQRVTGDNYPVIPK